MGQNLLIYYLEGAGMYSTELLNNLGAEELLENSNL
jgi:hypothetical protein